MASSHNRSAFARASTAIAAAELGCWGAVDRVRGLASAMSGDTAAARAQLITARDASVACGATYWAARCHAGPATLVDGPST